MQFEFVYLGLLSRDGLKPVSRWEARFRHEEIGWLKKLGLHATVVERRVPFGRRRPELVFGRSSRWVDFYVRRFDGKPIRRDPRTMRLEGQLFGYPSCCVEHYVKHGYAGNGLQEEHQQLFFHWVCPGCRVTPLLVPEYRRCYREALKLINRDHTRRSRRLRAAILTPVAASALLIATPVLGQSGDPHVLPLPEALDANRNGLLDRYEEALTHPPLTQDAAQLGREFLLAIRGLPDQPQTDRPYAIPYPLWGLETCVVCDTTVNMGFLRIVNPVLGDSTDLPFIALHALEHGSLDYLGDLHRGRLNVLRLLRVLGFPYATHAQSLGAELDSDDDGLPDEGEKRLGLVVGTNDADSNRVVDGPQLAVDWAAEIRALPLKGESTQSTIYRLDRLARDSVEVCAVCGQSVNAGYVEIVNELENFRVEVPFLALHALEHGSFVSSGVAAGRVIMSPRRLHCALHADGTFHQHPVHNDSDSDGLTDEEEAVLGTDAREWDTDDDGVPDGRQLAWRIAETLETLPREPRFDGAYLQEFPQRGLEVCEVCGETVNMGFVRVVNPLLQDSLDVPYIAWHALRHGAFTAQGSLHELRVDPVRLATLLSVVTSSDVGQADLPKRFGLIQAHPNPFSERTHLRVVLPAGRAREAEVEIFDLLARRVCTLGLRTDGSGTAFVTWDGRGLDGRPLPSGIYFCRVRGHAEVPFTRLVLLR